MNFDWIIENEVAGHSTPTSEADLRWLFNQGIRALVRMDDNPQVSIAQINKMAPPQKALSGF